LTGIGVWDVPGEPPRIVVYAKDVKAAEKAVGDSYKGFPVDICECGPLRLLSEGEKPCS